MLQWFQTSQLLQPPPMFSPGTRRDAGEDLRKGFNGLNHLNL